MKLRAIATAALTALALSAAAGCAEEQEPLKIGLLLDYTGSPDVSVDRQRGLELAVAQVNEEGGVLGKPVEFVMADAPGDMEVALASVRRLIEEEGVHAIVGPNSSAASTRIAQEITGPAGIPTISPSATAPSLTDLDDGDFFFRATVSDAFQGPVLARIVREQGFTNVGLTYRDDPYGRGLAEVFQAEWDGDIAAVVVPIDTTDYAPLVRRTASGGAEALVVIDFGGATQAIVQAAVDEGLYDRFFFGDAGRRLTVVQGVGGEHLGGQYGTVGAPPPPSEVGQAWNDAFVAMFGALPLLTYVKETYDAAMAIMLAAEQAGSLDGADIRDNLRSIATQPGVVVHATPDGVAEALRLIRDGEEINFEGAGGTLEWDDKGDLSSGHIGVWRFTADERIEEVEVVEAGR